MSALASLKLVNTKKTTHVAPVVQRRNKLVKALHQQILLATAQSEGRSYAPTKMRSVVDAATGLTTTVEVPKRVKPFWFIAENGKCCIAVKYGAKTVELAKGKFAVEVANGDELIATLEVLKNAVAAGELDTQIEGVSSVTRSNFKK